MIPQIREDKYILICLSIVFIVFILHICSLRSKMVNTKYKISSQAIIDNPRKIQRTTSQNNGLHTYLPSSDGNSVNSPILKRNITYGHFLYFDEKRISKGDDYMYLNQTY